MSVTDGLLSLNTTKSPDIGEQAVDSAHDAIELDEENKIFPEVSELNLATQLHEKKITLKLVVEMRMQLQYTTKLSWAEIEFSYFMMYGETGGRGAD